MKLNPISDEGMGFYLIVGREETKGGAKTECEKGIYSLGLLKTCGNELPFSKLGGQKFLNCKKCQIITLSILLFTIKLQ
jgi:hypothetical protein